MEKLKFKVLCGKQIEQSILFSLLLSFSGGFQDSYTYLMRDNVFANAQTGNIVLASTCLLTGEWQRLFRYIFPIVAFVVGILLVELICYYNTKFKLINWKQFVLLFECIIMVCVGFIPQEYNIIATIVISLSCAMQVQTFQKVGEHSYASTMCIGNLRNGAVHLSTFFKKRERAFALSSLKYLAILITFGLGAGVCSTLTSLFLEKTIWICGVILAICFILLFKKDRTTQDELNS